MEKSQGLEDCKFSIVGSRWIIIGKEQSEMVL